MKAITLLTALLLTLTAAAQRATNDSLFYHQQIPFLKPDTIRFNVLTNDIGMTKVLSYYVGCTRYAAGTTWRSIRNFGKIQLQANGKGIFVTTKPIDSVMRHFRYLAEGACGGDGGTVWIGDYSFMVFRDPSKVWVMVGDPARPIPGYYATEQSGAYQVYFIQMPDRRIFVTKQAYEDAVKYALH